MKTKIDLKSLSDQQLKRLSGAISRELDERTSSKKSVRLHGMLKRISRNEFLFGSASEAAWYTTTRNFKRFVGGFFFRRSGRKTEYFAKTKRGCLWKFSNYHREWRKVT